MSDPVHMLISIPPKSAVCQVIGCIKGKSAIHPARLYGEHQRNVSGPHVRARGYVVSTVGRDEEAIRTDIQHHERGDERLDQLKRWR
jgi:putative transposase